MGVVRAAGAALVWLAEHPRFVPACFVAFLAVRLPLLFLIPEPFSDGGWYVGRAAEMAITWRYAEQGIPTAFWPVGWPATMAGLFHVFGADLHVVFIANLLFASASFFLVVALGGQLLNSPVAGRIAALLLALYPNNAAYVALPLTETFFTFLQLLAVWLYVTRRTMAGLLLCGLVFGAATLTKTQTLLIPPLLLVLHAAATWRRAPVARAVLHAAPVVLGMALVIAPWTLRNHQAFGEFVLVSTNGGVTLLTGNNPSATGRYSQMDPLFRDLDARRTVRNQIEIDREAKALAVAWIRENPDRFVRLMPMKLWRLWAPDGEAEWSWQAGFTGYEKWRTAFRTVRVTNQAWYVAILGLCAGGIALLAYRAVKLRRLDADGRWAFVPLLLMLHVSAIAMVFSGQSRFHFPVMPFVDLMAGWLVVRFVDQPVRLRSAE